MSLEKKTFAMSMFVKAEDLYRAKATHYEEQAEKLQMELTVAETKLAYLERKCVEMARAHERLQERFENVSHHCADLENDNYKLD